MEHYPWIAERAGLVVGPSFRAIEAVDASGRILAMVGYDGWLGPECAAGRPNACSLHVALEHPAALRHVLRHGFEIPFVRLGIQLVTCMVLSSNERSLTLVRRLGFRETMRGVGWWAPGVDMVLFEMRRESCRWVPIATRQRKEAA